MPVVEETILINAPREGLFALSQDYALRTAWDPFTRSSTFLGGATEPGPGVRVVGRAWNGLAMEVAYTSYLPPRSVAMKMTKGPWLFRQFAGTWLFKEHPSGLTEVTFRYSFSTRPWWLRPLLDRAVRAVFRRDVRARLVGLKRGAEELGLLDRLGQPCG